MNELARLDLERFRIESESFLGQALALGMRFDKLPDSAGDAVQSFLQQEATRFARRYRSGIGIPKDALERGVRRAVVCLELGLADAAGGDLNAAVGVLEKGDFDALRTRGWELAFRRLEDMREASHSLLKQPEAALLQDSMREVRRWARLVPETWEIGGSSDDEEPASVDPLRDYAAYRNLRCRLSIVEAVPRPVKKELRSAAGGGCAFGDLLRNVILSVALDLESLVPDVALVERFQRDCFDGGTMRPEVRAKVLRLVGEQIQAGADDAEARAKVLEDVEAEIATLEAASTSKMAGFFILRKEAGGRKA